jgi:hypothetical protein
MEEITGVCVFTKLDFRAGYHQIELEEESRSVTTFCTHEGLYRYKRLGNLPHMGANKLLLKLSLNAWWWFGFRAINQFKWLMVTVEGKLFSYQIQMETFTAPYHCKGFFLCIRVATFSGGKGGTGIYEMLRTIPFSRI